MENFQAIYKIAIRLALFACPEILFTEGRHLKTKPKREGSRSMSSIDNTAKQPSHIPSSIDPSVARKKVAFPPMKPNHSFNLQDSYAVHKDDFRPTEPGNSPGVGHSFSYHEADVESKTKSKKSSGDRHSPNGFTDDFRPTSPGHSPGIGHVLQNKSAEPNA